MYKTEEEALRNEFNRWANAGRGEGMIEGHIDVTEQIVEAMGLKPRHRALDLGCGIGWATRMMAAHVSQGMAIGIDISDEMIHIARRDPANSPNVFFFNATATALPFDRGHFNRLLSIESLYYYPDIPAALAEVYRVMADGGKVFFMVNLYSENDGSHQWVEKLAVPVSMLSELEYKTLFEASGFRNVTTRRVLDRRPLEELLKPKSSDTREQIRKAAEAGSLVITGEK
ncbi:MAG TPA: class I SAM-dependent methyltransferase [Blastocatellia bacterium]|nr:class I SAM-dependent methyltransferase [Blastocatellia bacterium]